MYIYRCMFVSIHVDIYVCVYTTHPSNGSAPNRLCPEGLAAIQVFFTLSWRAPMRA